MSSQSRGGVTALAWTLTGVGVALTAGRYLIRMKTVGHLKWDDAVHGIAVIVMIGYIASYTIFLRITYPLKLRATGVDGVSSDNDLIRHSHLEFVHMILFWTAIYAIKISFLLFYRDIFRISHQFMKAWWAVFTFTWLTFLVCILSLLLGCGRPQDLFVVEFCRSKYARNAVANILRVWCSLNVISDVLITKIAVIGLPLFMVKGLNMPTTRKLGLAALFTLATIDVIFDILRTIYSTRGAGWTIWDMLEPTIAVIVSSLPTYRALFGTGRKRSTDKNLVPNHKNVITARNLQDFEMAATLRSENAAPESYQAIGSYPSISLNPTRGSESGPVIATDMV